MKPVTMLLLTLIILPCSSGILRCQDARTIVPPPDRFPSDTLRTGAALDGIKYYLKLIPADTTRGDRMPVVPPSDFIVAETQPVPLKTVQPAYPDKSGLKGTVWVKCLIGKDGKVKKTEVMKADNRIFIEPAIRAAKQWLFTPAFLHGKPVETWAALPFRFGGKK